MWRVKKEWALVFTSMQNSNVLLLFKLVELQALEKFLLLLLPLFRKCLFFFFLS